MIDHCMQSFSLKIAQNTIASSAIGACRTWGTIGQYFFSCGFSPSGANSFYNIEGFKNIDIYGMQVVGSVTGNPGNATKCGLVTDWQLLIGLDGNPPLVSGSKTASPDGFNLITSGTSLTYYHLGKYANILTFQDPLKSVKQIVFAALYAQGNGAEFLNEVALSYTLTFTFFYKYEGED